MKLNVSINYVIPDLDKFLIFQQICETYFSYPI